MIFTVKHNGYWWTMILAVGLMANACAKKKDSGSGSDSDDTNKDDLNLPQNPPEVFEFIDASVSSAMDSDAGESIAGGGLLIDSELALIEDAKAGEPTTYCSSAGDPIHPTASENTDLDEEQSYPIHLNRSHADYAAGKFFCLIDHNTGDEWSVQGAYDSVRMVMCLTKGELKFDGSTVETSVDKLSELLDVCPELDPGDDEESQEILNSSVSTKITGHIPPKYGDGTWDASFNMDFSMTDENGEPLIEGFFKLLFKSSDGVVSMAVIQPKMEVAGSEDRDAYAITVDTKTGTLRYELKSQRMIENGQSISARLLAKGDLKADGSFKSVDSYEGLYATAYGIEDGGDENPPTSATIYSIAGDIESGFKTHAYFCNIAPCTADDGFANYSETVSGGRCYGTDGSDCSENDGIVIDDEEDIQFIMDMSHSDFLAAEDWFEALAPLSFETVKPLQEQ